MPTDRTFTADEIHVRLLGYLRMYGLTLECVDEIAFAGVVPQLTREWRAFAQRIAARSIAVGADTAAVTCIHAPHPEEVGADRIANAVAAEKLYGAPSIVVDFGTATNIDVVDSDGYYIGGAIAPGLRISMDALVARAARIASIPLETRPTPSAAPLKRPCRAAPYSERQLWSKGLLAVSGLSWERPKPASSRPEGLRTSWQIQPTYSMLSTGSSPSRASAR